MMRGRGNWHKWESRSHWPRSAPKDCERRSLVLVPTKNRLAQVEFGLAEDTYVDCAQTAGAGKTGNHQRQIAWCVVAITSSLLSICPRVSKASGSLVAKTPWRALTPTFGSVYCAAIVQ